MSLSVQRLRGAVSASPKRPYLVKELCPFNTLRLYDAEDLIMPAELLYRVTVRRCIVILTCYMQHT
jgi:hypothetical protein